MSTKTYRAGAFMDAASRQGIEVAVGSEEEHVLTQLNPSGHIKISFHDLESSTSDIVDFVEKYPVDAIIATDDDGTLLAAMASSACGLPHNSIDSVASARNKYETRQRLSRYNSLPNPKYWRFPPDTQQIEEASRQVNYPCVLKPLALSASRGVMKANSPNEFIFAFKRLQAILKETEFDMLSDTMKDVLVEEFIPGQEVALEAILIDQKLTPLALFDKPDPLDGPFFQETIYVTPSRHPKEIQETIIETAKTAVQALGLHSGPVHIEMRINDSGVWVLEVAPRSIGGYCSRALRFKGDLMLEDLIIQEALDSWFGQIQPVTPASGVMMIPIPCAGILCKIDNLEIAKQVPKIEEIRITVAAGDVVLPPPEGSQYLGFIFARGQTPSEVESALRAAHSELDIVIDEFTD